MSVIQKRKKETALRKNTKLIIFLTLFFWVVLACVIFFVDPYSPGAKLSFFFLYKNPTYYNGIIKLAAWKSPGAMAPNGPASPPPLVL